MPDITMPQLGETVTEGTITKWFKKVGEQVKEDEPLFEVSTDKVDSEVPSSASGVVSEILVQEGETVDVGAKLAVIEAGDGSAKAAPAPEQKEAPKDDEPAEADKAEVPSAEEQAEPVPEDSDVRPPSAEAEAATAEERPPPPESKPEPEAKPARASGAASGRLLSPVVRRLINENELDPEEISGTGQDGRITRADVLAYLDRNGGTARAGQKTAEPAAPARAEAPAAKAAPAAPAAKEAPAAPAAKAVPKPVPKSGADDEVIPFSNIRRRTAEHMIRSQATSAHVLVATEVDYAGVDKVRKAAKDEFKANEGFSLTYLPFISRAVIDAIADFPHVNASVGNDELIVHRRIHLGFAVDINFEGLIVPVIHDADGMRLRALARSFSELARKARSRELTADDISGGTFTITNPGPFGTFLTYAVINQPQVAILSTDGIRKKPVAVELPDGTDAVVVHPVGMLGLSFDHRAFDGAYASAFIARVKEILETRDWAQEL
ncbi:MAG TPA: dihydrolipoamide acetyltransferase family protein [Acidimicrobiales bacterium]